VNSNSCNVIREFTYPPYTFAQVVSLSPNIHPVNHVEYPLLHVVTFAVFPAYQCEFTGSESDEELKLLYSKLVQPANTKRTPKPLVRIRFKNSRTGVRSVGSKLGLTTYESLVTELQELRNADQSFVEFENYQKSRVTVEWNKGYVWKDTSGAHRITKADLMKRTESLIFQGQETNE
jgi:hypothetical protein